MKKISLFVILVSLMTTFMWAQPGNDMPFERGRKEMRGMRGPGPQMTDMLELTADQQKQMKDLKLKLDKDILPLRTDLMKTRGELRILKAEDKPNLKAIYSKIDEITALKAKIMKLKAKHQLDVKNILTEEQRLKWEQHQLHKRGYGGKKGAGRWGHRHCF